MTNRGIISNSKETVHRSLKTPDFYFRQLLMLFRTTRCFCSIVTATSSPGINERSELKATKRKKSLAGISRYFSAEGIKKEWPQYELAIAKAEGRFEEQGWRVRKDGSRFWANITLTAIKDEKDKPNGFLKITRDLTAQKQAEEQRVQLAHEQAAEVAKEKAETAVKRKTGFYMFSVTNCEHRLRRFCFPPPCYLMIPTSPNRSVNIYLS
jgi:hypothetical protein